MFENAVHADWMRFNRIQPFWIEDESYEIGRISLPNPLFARIREGELIKLVIPAEVRAENLAEEYGKCPMQLLEDAFLRIQKRLGNELTQKAIMALQSKDYFSSALISLQYYDKAYDYGLKRRDKAKITILESATTNVDTNTKLIKDHLDNEYRKQGSS